MENFKRQIFEQLGYLFYALAADQEVKPMESGELKMLIKKDWLTDPKSLSRENVSEAAHLIGLTIDSLQNEGASPTSSFKSFAEFYQKNPEIFSEALKSNIMETATAIVKLFPSHKGKNNTHVSQVKSMFDKVKSSNEIGS